MTQESIHGWRQTQRPRQRTSNLLPISVSQLKQGTLLSSATQDHSRLGCFLPPHWRLPPSRLNSLLLVAITCPLLGRSLLCLGAHCLTIILAEYHQSLNFVTRISVILDLAIPWFIALSDHRQGSLTSGQ